MDLDTLIQPGLRIRKVRHDDHHDVNLGIHTIIHTDFTGFWSADAQGKESYTPLHCMAQIRTTDTGFEAWMGGVKRLTYTFVKEG